MATGHTGAEGGEHGARHDQDGGQSAADQNGGHPPAGGQPLQSALTFGGGGAVSWGAETPVPAQRGARAGRGRVPLAALVAGVLVVGALATRGGGANPSPRRAAGGHHGSPALTQAAYVTAQSPGFQFDLTISGGIGSSDFSFSGEGSMNERQVEGTMSTQVDGLTMNEVIKNPYIYVQLPSGNASLAAGKPWVRVDLDSFTQALGASDQLGQGGSDPTQMLTMLRASGQPSVVGSESVRGVQTTHYHALVDLGRYAEVVPADQRSAVQRSAQLLERVTGSSSLPVDVWVDAQQRVRRFSTELHVCTPQGTLDETVSMDLFDYGPQPAVTVPAASEVSDLTGALASRTSSTMAQLGC
jgi:hypothetical protein